MTELRLASVRTDADTQEPVDIHDRVADAYYGRLGETFMRETQRRIHWICAQVTGESVLDIGCSQGIGAILLGREGKRVAAVDVDPKAIAHARQALSGESQAVQSRVVFTCADAAAHAFDDARFDTVVLAEVLEHLAQPARLVEVAASRLETGGRIVVTTPFGINDFIDHKHTFYVCGPRDLLAPWFEIEQVVVLGKWLGMVGRRRGARQRAAVPQVIRPALLQTIEEGFFALERELRDDLAAARARLHDANTKYRGAGEQIAALKQKLEQGDSDRAVREATLQADVKALREKLDAANDKYRQANEQIAQSKQTRQGAESAQAASAAKLTQLEVQLELHKLRLEQSQEQTKQLQARLERSEAALESTRQSAAALQHQKTAVEQAAAHAAELATMRADAELAAVRQRLDDANLKYRAVTEQVAQLKVRLADEQQKAAAAVQRERALEAERKTIAGERDALQRALAESQGNVQSLSKQLAHAQAEAATLVEQLQALSSQRDADRAAAANEIERHARAAHEANAERDAQLARLQALDAQRLAERTATDAEIEHHARAIQRAQAEVAALAEQLHALSVQRDADRAAAAAEIERHAEAARQAGAERDAQRERLQALGAQREAERAATAAEIEEHVHAVQQARAEAAALAAQLQASSAQRDAERAAAAAALESERDHAARRSSELETQAARSRSLESDFERLKVDAVRQKLALADAHAQLERVRGQAQAAQQQVAKTRATISFQLGHALLFGFKSWGGFTALPGKLRSIRHQALERREQAEPAAGVIEAARPVLPILPALARKTFDQPTALLAPLPAEPAATRAAPGFALKSLKVAAIMDEFTHTSYRDECNLLQLTPQHWQRELEAFEPQLLFIESAWRGKDELWGSKVGHMSQELVGIVQWCRERGVPTAFWNKEDPVHFETFLSTAKHFDHVFTTDIDCIGRYKAALGHERVWLLPFAAQPALSNPVETYERKDAFCFAGAYYTRYPERTRDLGDFVASLPSFKPVEIYDRNFGKDDPNHRFPDEYQPFIVGNLPFEQIDKAYKGYRYAINLNSIKQSQSMFARRVFELLASNTVTVSNFSRGVRLMFGDLVLTSDSGADVVRRLKAVAADEAGVRKLRLAGLRKVMREHTYQDRFAYLASKLLGRATEGAALPRVVVTAHAKDEAQAQRLFDSFSRQTHKRKSLVLVVPSGFAPPAPPAGLDVRVIGADESRRTTLADITAAGDWLAVMVPDDYYGANHLLDLALATRYAAAPVVGRAAHHVWSATQGLKVHDEGRQYRRVTAVPARAGAIRADRLPASSLRDWAAGLYAHSFEDAQALAIDEFNYCKNAWGAGFGAAQIAAVDDAAGLDAGLGLDQLLAQAEATPPAVYDDAGTSCFGAPELAALLGKAPQGSRVTMGVEAEGLRVESQLPDGKHEYWYATQDHAPAALGAQDGRLRLHLEATPGLNLQLVLLFLDAAGQRVHHQVMTANRNHEAIVPPATARVRLGLRVYAGGCASVKSLLLGHRDLDPAQLLARGEHLVLTNHYPSHQDLYRNGFVHRRVAAYREAGVAVDVFRLRQGEPVAYHEFENVDCITGSASSLSRLLAGGRYKSVLVHFLDEAMWQVLRQCPPSVRIVVWLHGAEIHPWHRRAFNYKTDEERADAQRKSDRRMAFWRELLGTMPPNLHLVFVSRSFADEVMSDLGLRLPAGRFSVIHNPIETTLFAYAPKAAAQRKKILSIRPFASAQYANDLSVQAIVELSRRPGFADYEFRLIGEGALFDETVAPLRALPNVTLERRFATQQEIAELHKSYGLFLCPTRWDSQGVSRDEAMASGLVPITSAVAAVPEFAEADCAVLAPAEDAKALADGIERIAGDAALFARMSARAAARVREQREAGAIVRAELALVDR